VPVALGDRMLSGVDRDDRLVSVEDEGARDEGVREVHAKVDGDEKSEPPTQMNRAHSQSL